MEVRLAATTPTGDDAVVRILIAVDHYSRRCLEDVPMAQW
jgi:hypothetical protein